tara:strand:- start:5522 stop:6037 length:516 start_codon:yes stop_codon:yes gene_type:complete
MTEEITNYMQIESNEVNNPSYREVFNSRKRLVCLLPNACREQITVSLPREIHDLDLLFKTFSESLQLQYTKMKIYVLSIRAQSDKLYQLEMNIVSKNDDKQYYYDIVYIMVPKELIYKFENEGINHIIFYIGKSKNKNEFKILNGTPSLDIISTENSQGTPLPFSWGINLS